MLSSPEYRRETNSKQPVVLYSSGGTQPCLEPWYLRYTGSIASWVPLWGLRYSQLSISGISWVPQLKLPETTAEVCQFRVHAVSVPQTRVQLPAYLRWEYSKLSTSGLRDKQWSISGELLWTIYFTADRWIQENLKISDGRSQHVATSIHLQPNRLS
jgi:hypothetical protein